MSNKNDLAAAGRFLLENDHFLVVNHVSPDGDATGSLLAMGYILKFLGKSFVLGNEGATPTKFLTGALASSIHNLSEESPTTKFSHVIALDCGDLKRLGKTTEYIDDEYTLLNIDHHPTNDKFGHVNIVQPEACATCEILYDLCKELQIPFSVDLANSLYMGIMTDTGGFRYSNTTTEVLHKAADLLSYGVSAAEVAERCLETISPSYIKLLQEVLPTLQLSFNNMVAMLTISMETVTNTGASSEDMEGIVHYARNIEGVEVGILFKQLDAETVKMSLRSRKFIDVSLIAKALGGGGHARAAGCTFKGTLEEARNAVTKKLKACWDECQ